MSDRPNNQDKPIKKGDVVWVVIGVSIFSYDCIPRPIQVDVVQVKYGKVQVKPGPFWLPEECIYGTKSEALFRSRPLVRRKLEHYRSDIATMEEWLEGGDE